MEDEEKCPKQPPIVYVEHSRSNDRPEDSKHDSVSPDVGPKRVKDESVFFSHIISLVTFINSFSEAEEGIC